MEQQLKSFLRVAPSLGCFYCGVDSTELKIFLFSLIGSLVMGTVLVGIGMVVSGRFKDPESLKFQVLEAEQKEWL
jgi:hypothetical protein